MAPPSLIHRPQRPGDLDAALKNLSRLETFLKRKYRRHPWTVSCYALGDEAGILQLGHDIYGWHMDVEEWRWKYLENPAGRGAVLVTRDDKSGRIIGHHAAIPFDKCLNGQTEKDFLVVDSAVDPAYQRKGLYVELFWKLAALVKNRNGSTIFGLPNRQAYPATLKMGGEALATVPMYVHVLNWGNVLGRVRALKPAAWLVRCVSRAFSRTVKRNPTNRGRHTLEEIFSIDQELARTICSWLPNQWIATQRDEAYLNWRYFKHPKTPYRVFRLDNEGTPTGIVVARVIEKWNLRIGAIVDLVMNENNQAIGQWTLEPVLQIFTEARVDAAVSFMSAPPNYQALLRRSGFWSSRLLWTKRPFHLVAHRFSPDSEPKPWFLSLGDTDLV